MEKSKNAIWLMLFSFILFLIPHVIVHADDIVLLENENAKAEFNIDTAELLVLEVYQEWTADNDEFVYPWDELGYMLKSVKFSENVKKVPDAAFSGCKNIEKVDFTGIMEIGVLAFYECNSIKEVTLSDMKRIGDVAFSSCYLLKDVNLSNIDSIGVGAFMECINIEQVKLSNIKEIGMDAFYRCKYLLDVHLDDVKDIPENAFSLCYSLRNLNLNGVETIGYRAFYDDCALVSIDLSTVKSVDEYAFGKEKDSICENKLEVVNASKKIKKSKCFGNREVVFVKGSAGDGNTSNLSVKVLLVVAVGFTVLIFKKFITK